MQETNSNDAEIIIAQNKEEWDRLLFLLKDPDPNILWINCDTSLLKMPLHAALTSQLPELKPYNIYINEETESLSRIIFFEDEGKIPENAIIHVFGLEDAIKSTEFLGNLNFQRDSLFRKTPATIIFWADFATGTTLLRKAYDFWSWVVFTFNFSTPENLLTARQKDFGREIVLEDTIISLPNKDSDARIRHLELEWDEFLKSVNGKPSTIKQMKDAVTIAFALVIEYRDEAKFQKIVELIQIVLNLNPVLINEDDCSAFNNDLASAYSELGDFSKAKDLCEKNLKYRLGKYGTEDIELGTLQSNLAVIYWQLGKLDRAKELSQAALSSSLKFFKEDDTHIATLQSVAGLIHRKSGELNIAKDLLEKALNTDIKNFPSNHPILATRYLNLAGAYQSLGEYYKAKTLLEKALAIDLMNFDENHSRIATCHNNLAYVLVYLQDIENAKYHLQMAYVILSKTLGESNPRTNSTLSFLKKLENK